MLMPCMRILLAANNNFPKAILFGYKVDELVGWFVLYFVCEKGVYLVLASQREQTPLNL